ncbi:MAG: ketoacyl-ACP synthase III [Dehalococcoidia bacterium]|nr:ketoacyl-ACP synthase III [Dehalococcoidia bacterium]
MQRYAKVKGSGIYLPQKRITNAELGEQIGYDVEKYLGSKGIKVRFQAGPDESTSAMSVRAAQNALNKANMKAEDLDFIILATDTPDYITPPTSPIIQHNLGAKNCGVFDINDACADETIALALGSQFIMLDPEINNVMVIGTYGMTRWLDWGPYENSVSKVLATLFSDGSAAIILTKSDEPGYMVNKTVSEGEYWDTYGIYIGTANPPTAKALEHKKQYLGFHPNRHKVPSDYNVVRWPRMIRETCRKGSIAVQDINMVLMNQVEYDSIELTMKELGLPMSRTHWIADRLGYAGSASALMALHEVMEQNKLRKGDHLMLCTSGAGFVLATTLFRWV